VDVFSRASLPLSRLDTIIVIDRDIQALCEFSKPRQVSESRTLASCWIGEGVIVVKTLSTTGRAAQALMACLASPCSTATATVYVP
jgi:hypothetical protein